MWNVRGLNSDTKQKYIKWFLHQSGVDLFGILETKVKPESLNRVASNVCQNWSYITNTACHSGGRVWILWKQNKLDVALIDMDAQYIHNALIRLAGCGPWVVLGDFNNVMFANERIGKIFKDEEMLPFQSTVALCDLQDMKSTGAFFTWNNKQPSETRIFGRIDRVLVNDEWLNKWPDWFARFQPEVVLAGWNVGAIGTTMFRVVKKLKLLKSYLKGLNRGLFSDIERNADVAYKLLMDCQLSLHQDKTNKELMDKERELRQSYYLMATAKEDFLRQKAKS
ncbi:uncharacterized protein LOC141618494 [Silene latifolia]|uniref:uncharacterized protein LOC141618494 n=1 Tax=Silene latifolia TaxID=37657 RepID=UPI003D78137D